MSVATRSWRLVSVNVNGIRAAARRGGLDWLVAARPDVVCLQEVRATHEQLHEALGGSALRRWHVSHVPAPQLGRAGVAVLTRVEPLDVRERVGSRALDGSGRWIEVDVPGPSGPLTVVSVYVHSGEADTPRQDDKYVFLAAMDRRMRHLRNLARSDGPQAVVCGDLNIAHRDLDLANWRGNRGKAGCLPQERAYLDRWLRRDWVDLGRAHGGSGPGPYTWWSWRGQAFDTDTGWRIDYAVATPGLADRCVAVNVGRAASYDARWSDHAPIAADFIRG